MRELDKINLNILYAIEKQGELERGRKGEMEIMEERKVEQVQ